MSTKNKTKSDSITLSTSLSSNSSEKSSKSTLKSKLQNVNEKINIVNPYINTNLASQVLLKPNQLDNNIYINMKQNLKKYLEGKCNKYGFIQTIHKIIEHNDGLIVPEDLSGSVLFNVKYSALVCIPIENTNIICKITNIENNLFTAQNGPILIVLKQSDINNDIFMNERNIIMNKKTRKSIDKEDYVTVFIRNKRYYTNDTTIIAMGRLENIPTDEEVNKYFNPPKVNEDEIENKIKEQVLESIYSININDNEKTNIIDL
jgi:DNA-directed RNA polymerase subunit E'/Rpb7